MTSHTGWVVTIVALGLMGCVPSDADVVPATTVDGYGQLGDDEKRQHDRDFVAQMVSFRTCEDQVDPVVGHSWRTCTFVDGPDSLVWFSTSGPSTPVIFPEHATSHFYGIRMTGLSTMMGQGDPCIFLFSVFDTLWVQGWATLDLRTGDVYPGVTDDDAPACNSASD